MKTPIKGGDEGFVELWVGSSRQAKMQSLEFLQKRGPLPSQLPFYLRRGLKEGLGYLQRFSDHMACCWVGVDRRGRAYFPSLPMVLAGLTTETQSRHKKERSGKDNGRSAGQIPLKTGH